MKRRGSRAGRTYARASVGVPDDAEWMHPLPPPSRAVLPSSQAALCSGAVRGDADIPARLRDAVVAILRDSFERLELREVLARAVMIQARDRTGVRGVYGRQLYVSVAEPLGLRVVKVGRNFWFRKPRKRH